MQTKVTVTLVLGFVMGLGLASCASVESHRTVAGDSSPQYAKSAENREARSECQAGEERGESGECQRPYNFDRPFRKGGR